MPKTDARLSTWKLRSSYFTTIMSISLVLFMLGLMGMLIFTASRVSTYVMENIGFTVFLRDSVKEVNVRYIQKELDIKNYVKSTKYVSKDEAATELKEELGEDFVNFLGFNPLLSSIDVKLHAEYANPDSIKFIEQKLLQYPEIKEVSYQKSLVNLLNENVKKITAIILIFSILLLVISSALINNTIRLSVYSKRFLINTMQLVGATESFIRRPFLIRSAVHGLIGAGIAIFLLAAISYIGFREFNDILEAKYIIITFVTVVLLGIIVTCTSTYFAVNKYLRMNSDEMYY